MNLKLTEVNGLVTGLLTAASFFRWKKKAVKQAFCVLAVLALSAMVWAILSPAENSSSSNVDSHNSVSTTGNNSPATQQNAISTGSNSPVIQTVNNFFTGDTNTQFSSKNQTVTPGPAFSMTRSAFATELGEEPHYWCVEEGGGRLYVTPMRGADYVFFKNLLPKTIMMQSWCFQRQLTNQDYVDINSFNHPMEHEKIYYGDKLNDVVEMKWETLNSKLRNHNIAPGESVSGWVFFPFNTNPPVGHCRFTFQDTEGNSYSESLKAGGSPHGSVAASEATRTTNHLDISKAIFTLSN